MISTRNLALGALLTGLGVVALSAMFLTMGIRSVHPLNGAFGDQAILAFELAQTPDQLATVIGGNPPDADALAVREVMDRANRLDFAYMAVYGAFIALACACAARRRNKPWLLLGVALGPLAALADVAENRVLLQLTQPDAAVATLLPSLHARTLCKWELLALASALFAAGFVERGRPLVSVIAGMVALLALATGVMSVIDAPRYLAALSGVIVVVWLWQLGYAATSISSRGS